MDRQRASGNGQAARAGVQAFFVSSILSDFNGMT
jgi:hypothetical protein